MQHRRSERWRWHLRAAIAAGVSRLHDGLLSSALARPAYRPLILGYHRVVDDFDAVARREMPSMLTSRAMFERHLDWVGEHFRFASLDEIGEHIATGEPFDEPVAAVTFDDGYRDVYEHAFPALKRKGVPAAVFVVTDLVDKPFWQIHDRLYHLVAKAFATWNDPSSRLFGALTDLGIPATEVLGSRTAVKNPSLAVSALLPALPQIDVSRVIDYLETGVGNGTTDIPLTLTWPMIAEMRRGGITIGSHTKTHVSLPMESAETAREELAGSKRELEARLGEPVPHFAYPGGQFTPDVVDALANEGYRYAYTACPHGDARHPALTIERLLLWEGSSIDGDGHFSSAILNCQTHDVWPPARRCDRVHQL